MWQTPAHVIARAVPQGIARSRPLGSAQCNHPFRLLAFSFFHPHATRHASDKAAEAVVRVNFRDQNGNKQFVCFEEGVTASEVQRFFGLNRGGLARRLQGDQTGLLIMRDRESGLPAGTYQLTVPPLLQGQDIEISPSRQHYSYSEKELKTGRDSVETEELKGKMDPTNDTTYDNIFDEQWIPQLNEKDYYSSKETRTATNHNDQENTEKKKRSLEDEEDEIEEKELFPWLFDQNNQPPPFKQG